MFISFTMASLLLGLTLLSAEVFKGQYDGKFFLDTLISKYGDKGNITFEGLEHLMENLGLGKLRFEKNHTIWRRKTPDGGFREVHDILKLHEHSHDSSNNTKKKRSVTYQDVKDLESECMTPQNILEAYGFEADHNLALPPLGFLKICPAIVHQLDQKVCTLAPAPIFQQPPVSTSVAWLYGSLSILVISVSGLIAVTLVPFLEKTIFHNVLGTLVAVAVGSLCGDALIHLLPHALLVENEDHSMVVLKSSTTFFTLVIFFLLEACIHKGHSHDHNPSTFNANESEYDGAELSEYFTVPLNDEGKTSGTSALKTNSKALGRLVIIGDGLHNLTDGLAIGAAFRGDLAAGFATALAVLTHELPHELGDFAVLLKSGMTVRKAIYFNILSSVLSFMGMVIGIYIGEHKGASHWIYAATAGSFLYIALSDLVPELHQYRQRGGSMTLFLQITGTVFGGAIMGLIAIYEDSIYQLFDAHH